MLAVAFARFLEQTLVVCVQFFANNGICILQNLKLFRAYCANDADSQTRAGEGLTVNNMGRQAKGGAQRANLVLEEVVKRLNKVEVNTFREGDQVVVAFDSGSLSAGFASTRFNDVRIDGALSHKLHGLAVFCDILCNGEELFPELGTDNLALCFRVGNAVKQLGIALFGMNMNEIHIELLGKYLFNLFRLVLTKQAMVYEYAYQLLANCLSAQGCNYRRINAAGKA